MAWRDGTRRAIAALVGLLVSSVVFVIGAPPAHAANPLTIDKTSGPNPVAPGQQLTYTIVVTNTIGSKVTEVALTDVVQGLTGVDGTNRLVLSSSLGSCGQSGNTVTCTTRHLRGFETWTVTIRGMVTAADGTTLNNTASVTGTQSATTYTSVDTVSTLVDQTANEPKPDLMVTVKGPNTNLPSHDMVYTATVSNVGTSKASDVVLTITLPNSVDYVTANATSLFNCTKNPPDATTTTLTCTGGAVNAGTDATVQVGVIAPDFATQVTVSAAVDPFDAIDEANELNNFGQATTEVGTAQPAGTLALEKTDASDPIAPGETLTYTIRLENTSPDRADYVEVVDGTQGLEASSVTATVAMTSPANNPVPLTCTVSAPTVSCTTTRFYPGSVATITIKGIVVASPGSTILNMATVNGNIRNTGVTNTAATITTVRPAIDLTVTQHRTLPALPAPVRAADRFDYTVTVGNSGLYDATNVVVRQPLPTGPDSSITMDDVVFDGATPAVCGVAPDANGTNILTCTLPLVQGANSSGQIQGTTQTIVLHLIAPHAIGQISSTVTVDATNAIPEHDETNNTYTTVTDVLTGIDLVVSKTEDHDPVARNGTLRYTITVENLGTQDADGILVRDVLPVGTVFRSATDAPSSTGGDPAVLHNFTCSASGNVVDCVGGRLEGTYSGSLLENVDQAQILIDVFAPDEPGTYHNEVRVDPFGTIPEKDETNNLHLENTVVENGLNTPADGAYKELHISMLDERSADPPAYATSGVLDYDLVVANSGASPVGAPDNVVVRITLPAGAIYRAAYDLLGGDNAFVCAPVSGSVVECSGGTVESAGTRALRIETFAPPTPGNALIQAMVDPGNTIGEADETNNSATETTAIQAGEPPAVQGTYIELKVNDIVDSHDPVGTNSTLDYAVSVVNLGQATAFGVAFRATLPTGSTFISADDAAPAIASEAFQCSESGGVVTCTGARIDGGGARTVNIRIFAPGQPSTSDPATRARLSVLVDPGNAIPEGHEGNNSAEEFTAVQIDGPGGFVDLKIAQTATIASTDVTVDGSVIPGGLLTYKLDVTNDGTDDAFNVEVRNPLPAGMTFVSATPDDAASNFVCQQSGGVVSCSGGYVKGTDSGGGSRFITIKARAPMEHNLDIVNQAFVDPGNAIPEQSEVNNTSQAPNVVKSIVDLEATMGTGSAGGSGSEGTWTFTAKNTITEANSRASNVVVVANFSGGSIHIDTAVASPTTPDTHWSCEVFENPVNQVRCVGNFGAGVQEVQFSVHYFQTSDQDINGFVEIDPEVDTTDSIAGRIVEEDELNNTARNTG